MFNEIYNIKHANDKLINNNGKITCIRQLDGEFKQTCFLKNIPDGRSLWLLVMKGLSPWTGEEKLIVREAVLAADESWWYCEMYPSSIIDTQLELRQLVREYKINLDKNINYHKN